MTDEMSSLKLIVPHVHGGCVATEDMKTGSILEITFMWLQQSLYVTKREKK